MISSEILCCFRSFPLGYDGDSMSILPDMVTFRFFPVAGIYGTSAVPVRVNSGGNTASIFRIYFRPVPL